jgi:hypothetical protein
MERKVELDSALRGCPSRPFAVAASRRAFMVMAKRVAGSGISLFGHFC